MKENTGRGTRLRRGFGRNLPKLTKEAIAASICRSSFYEFVRVFWDTVIPEKPVWNWHIEEMCFELERVAKRVFAGKPKAYDLIINVPPGTTKSTIASVMFPIWCWTRMVSTRCICASYAYALAVDLSRKSRDVVKSDKFKLLFPEITLRDDQDSKGYFINERGGSRYSVGVNGSVMGMHAHFIIVDDPLDPGQALSEADIKTANHWLFETLATRKIDKSITPIILIMQRLHQEDPTGMMISKSDHSPVKHVCLPAELVEGLSEDDMDVSPPALRKYYRDGLLDPVRLPRNVLEREKNSIGEFGYAGQFLQNPSPRGGGMFYVDQLKYGIPPTEFKQIIRYWDKAATKGIKAAYSVGVKIARDLSDRVWILDVKRGRWDSFERETIIHQTAMQDGYGVRVGLEQEGGSGGKESAESTVRRLQGYSVVVNKVSASDGDKIQRADPLASQVNGGNVYLVQAPWNKDFIDELRHFPVSKFKDQVDASSGGYNVIARELIVVGGLW